MKKIKVLVIVENGIVQAVHANSELEYVVVDYDKQSDEPVIVGHKNAPDTVISSKDNFYEKLYQAKSTDSDEVYVHKVLKKMKF